MNEAFDLFLVNLTEASGVYRMLDENGVVLYVGKAVNLKKRVSSYFSRPSTSAKTRSLVGQIKSIDVSVTRTETEALLLESSLIKSLRPKYNVLLRDDKSYPFIHLTSHHPFPRMSAFRAKTKPTKGDYFGPYPSTTAVRETLTMIQKVFKIRSCTDAYFSARSRPCLQYQIKRCSAPCTAFISAKAYAQSVSDAKRFLQGKSSQILDELAVRMHDAVTRLAFEEAAVLRDQIKSLRLIQEQQGVVQHRGDADVIVLDAHPGRACILCVTIRAGEILASQAFFPKVPDLVVDEEISPEQAVFSAFIAHHYVDSPERIPALILTNQPVDHVHETEALLSELRGKRCRIQTNPRGANARWLDFAKHNLAQSMAQHAASARTMALRFKALCALIKRPYPLSRMECFDISHTQGDSTVASCVVFNENGPLKSDYRRFNIQGITPGDDYAAMEQALSRRFKRRADASFGCLPDVLIIDGGKGQLDVARRVLSDLNIEGVTLIGIAKGASRKAGWERLFINDAEEITLESDSEALHLLQHIRDEAHRFAITAHRAKRQKTSLSSSLTSIEGVGPKRRQALLSRFGGLRELAKAPVEELIKVQGIREDLAQRIYLHFHPKG